MVLYQLRDKIEELDGKLIPVSGFRQTKYFNPGSVSDFLQKGTMRKNYFSGHYLAQP